MLFDLSKDPYELNNLAGEKSMQKLLLKMRRYVYDWQLEMNDIGLFPEYYWIREAGANAVKYAQHNRDRIEEYLNLVNLQLTSFTKAQKTLEQALKSSDELTRYWALNVCSSFGREAESLLPTIRTIAHEDSAAAVMARAVEYIGLYGYEGDVEEMMLKALYKTSNPVEAMMILNSMTLLNEGEQNISFAIDESKLADSVTSDSNVETTLKKHR